MPTVGIVTGAASGMGFESARRVAEMVDILFLVDRDERALHSAAESLSNATVRASLHPQALDVTDRPALQALGARCSELGTLRAVAHAAGISPAMAEWRHVLSVDLVGTALVLEALRPIAGAGTTFVCFASIAATPGSR